MVHGVVVAVAAAEGTASAGKLADRHYSVATVAAAAAVAVQQVGMELVSHMQ